MSPHALRWIRDLLLVPLLVGLIIATFTIGLPRLLEKRRELSYEIDGPTPAFSSSVLRGVTVSANGVRVDQLFSYRVRIWNSGGIALKDVPVRLVLSSQPPGVRVLNISHVTTPAYEFAPIQDTSDSLGNRRFVFQDLNPGNEDV